MIKIFGSIIGRCDAVKTSSKSVTNIHLIFQIQAFFTMIFSFFSLTVKKAKNGEKNFCHKNREEQTICH